MITPFDITEEDEFGNANQNDIMSGEDVTRTQDFFSQLGEDRPFISEYTQDLPEDIAETRYNKFEDRPETELEKQERILSRTKRIGNLQKEEQFDLAESEKLGREYQEQEFAKARDLFRQEQNQEQPEEQAAADYEQRMAKQGQPVKEFVDIAAYADKVYSDELAILNEEERNLVANGALLGSEYGKLRKQQIDLEKQNLNTAHKLYINNVVGKGFSEAPMQIREVYQNNFLGAVTQGIVTPNDGLSYAYNHANIMAKVNQYGDQLKSEGKETEYNTFMDTVLGKVKNDRLGNPLTGPDGNSIREGGLAKMTNFGTYNYNTDEENFSQNFGGLLVRMGLATVEKPGEIGKDQEAFAQSIEKRALEKLELLGIDTKQGFSQKDIDAIEDPTEKSEAQKHFNDVIRAGNIMDNVLAQRESQLFPEAAREAEAQIVATDTKVSELEAQLEDEQDTEKKKAIQSEINQAKQGTTPTTLDQEEERLNKSKLALLKSPLVRENEDGTLDYSKRLSDDKKKLIDDLNNQIIIKKSGRNPILEKTGIAEFGRGIKGLSSSVLSGVTYPTRAMYGAIGDFLSSQYDRSKSIISDFNKEAEASLIEEEKAKARRNL